MRTSGVFVIAFGCMALALGLGALDVRAQYPAITSLSCHLRSCSGQPGTVCPDVPSAMQITIDLDHARARGGNVPDWVEATIDPDHVVFSRDVVDASGTDRESYSVDRTSLTTTWHRQSTPTGASEAAVDASARYQCWLVHRAF